MGRGQNHCCPIEPSPTERPLGLGEAMIQAVLFVALFLTGAELIRADDGCNLFDRCFSTDQFLNTVIEEFGVISFH